MEAMIMNAFTRRKARCGWLGSLVLSLVGAAPTWAQGVIAAPGPATAPGTNSTWSGALAVLALGVGLFVVIGAIVKVIDRNRKRTDDALYLQAMIGDAWLQQSALATLPLAATVHVPFRGSSRTRVEVTGHVPAPALRDAALTTVAQVASRAGKEIVIVDHISVASQAATRVA